MIKNQFRHKFVRKGNAALLALFAMILAAAASAQIPTVVLSDNQDATFQMEWKGDSKKPQNITFLLDSADAVVFPPDAQVTQCELRVVVKRTNKAMTGQDVAVLDKDKQQIGELHVSGEDTSPAYRTLLKSGSCNPSAKSLTVTLESKSRNTDWTYYGGKADDSASQPRLIVTYLPVPVRSGQSTNWKHNDPNAFWSSPLGPGKSLLTNPFSYADLVYVVAQSADGPYLYRVTGFNKGTGWKLKNPVEANSFAFVTASGRLQIITKNALYSCNLADLTTASALTCAAPTARKLTVNASEKPAMGPDGSLYFKNVDAAGAIVARNPVLREIWQTDLKPTSMSPITVSANGRYAYALADVAINAHNAATTIALLRIDTTTGETIAEEIADKGTKPLLKELFQPAVVSKVVNRRSVDYVFVAGNTGDTGILQLIAFEQGAKHSVVWSRAGKVQSAPVSSVVDGDFLFVVQGGKLRHYAWYSEKTGSHGAKSGSELTEETVQSDNLEAGTTLLVDGNDSVYAHEVNGSLFAYQSVSKKLSPAQKIGVNSRVLFTASGALIRYDAQNVYDVSPKTGTSLSPSALATWTTYSAERIAVPANPGVKAGDRVILKGETITFPNGFKWPLGAALSVHSVQAAP
jgi:hypothetical protein